MISFGRRNKVLFLALAIVATLVFIFVSPTADVSVDMVDSMQKADFTDSTTESAPGDDSLLSGAMIQQEKVVPEEKVYHDTDDKSNVVSGTDATLKLKEDAINKAETAEKAAAAKAAAADSAAKDTAKKSAGKKTTSDKNAAALADDDEDDVTGKGSAAKDTKLDTKKGKTLKSDAAAVDKDTTVGSSSKSGDDGYKYVIMIDAGSTGSRVHVYTFDTSSTPPTLINEDFEMLKPGLSSFDTDAEGAAASLDPLLSLALKSIPEDKHSCSPVAVKATAGLRLLGDVKSKAILKQVRTHLEEDYPFPVVKGDGVSIMEGSDEGVYAWITANYLSGNIGSAELIDTAAVFDLGGGSTQIVFEPTKNEKMIEGEHKYTLTFGGREFTLYQYSHLGYGLMQGRRQVNAAILSEELKTNKQLKPLTASEAKSKNLKATVSVENPCVPPGVIAEDVVVEMDDETKYIVNFVSPATDASDPVAKTDATNCKFFTESILNKEAVCASEPCSFNGVYQPSFKKSFSSAADMFVFSYFYDRLQPIGMPPSFTLQDMKDVTAQVCAGSHSWDQYFTQPAHIKELEDEPLWCQDLTFMTSLLHIGYDIPLTRELRTAKTIAGNELGWCLGASLPLLDKGADWSCKVTKDF